MRILIVEDDFLSRRVLAEMLDPYGACDCVASGEEAIIAVCDGWKQGTPYNLICLDIKMPGINGDEVLQLIRGQEEERGIYGLDMVPIIMVTTVHDAKTILSAFRNGLCDVYLIKPVEPAKLKQKMSELGFQPMGHEDGSLCRRRQPLTAKLGERR